MMAQLHIALSSNIYASKNVSYHYCSMTSGNFTLIFPRKSPEIRTFSEKDICFTILYHSEHKASKFPALGNTHGTSLQ